MIATSLTHPLPQVVQTTSPVAETVVSDILTKILDSKRLRLAAANQAKPLERIREQALAARAGAQTHRLTAALSRNDSINIIAEFKRRSPSKGVIRADVSPENVTRAYEAGGAAAISVLTEEDFFSGSIEDLRAVKRTTQLPVLRKDFIFDEYQVYESAAAKADALLLIAAALDDDALFRLQKLADELGLDALVEVHTESEMDRVLKSGAKLIGINNRDLKTFEVSIETSIKLAAMVEDERVLVSESGFNTKADLDLVMASGIRAFLIGESLMRSENPATALRALIGEDNSSVSNRRSR